MPAILRVRRTAGNRSRSIRWLVSGNNWQFDTFVLLYHQKDRFDVELYRVTPTVRMDYHFFDNWTFEASGGLRKR